MEEIKKKKSMTDIVKSSSKMAVATFLSRILGLVREQFMARYFGASALTDAFIVAYRIPNLLRDLFAEGAFSSAFVPIFTEAKHKGTARDLLWSTFILLTIITGLIGGAIYLFSDQLIHLFAPSFDSDPERFKLASHLTKYMSPFLLFVSLAALLMGVLNTLKIFFIPSLAPAFLNIVMILCMIFATPLYIKYGYEGIYSLGLGVLIGGVVQFFIQLPLIFKEKYGPIIPKEFFGEMNIKILKRMGPGLIGFAAIQINILITTILASSILGAVSWLNYAFRLYQFPVGIFGVSIGNTHLVHFSEAYKKNLLDEAKDYIQSSYIFSLFLMVPAVSFLFATGLPIVRLIFERGKFDLEDSLQTAQLLKCYALSLPFYGIYKIMIPTFYSINRQNVPVILTLISISINIATCLIFVPYFGVPIFATATSFTMLFNATGCMVLLTKILDLDKNFFYKKRFFTILFSGLIVYIISYFTSNLLYGTNEDSLYLKIIKLCVVGAFAVLSYGSSLYLLGEKELINKLLRKRRQK